MYEYHTKKSQSVGCQTALSLLALSPFYHGILSKFPDKLFLLKVFPHYSTVMSGYNCLAHTFLPPADEVAEKYMFSQMSVCHSVQG